MHTPKFIEQIEGLLIGLFERESKRKSPEKSTLVSQMDDLFQVKAGLRGERIVPETFTACTRWNIVMVGDSLNNIHYVLLEDGELKSIGPLKKINVMSHIVALEGQELFVLENLCPDVCAGMEVGRNQVAKLFAVQGSDLTFIAERLLAGAKEAKL